jgi:ATP-binding protein involved in chromosome partitioning
MVNVAESDPRLSGVEYQLSKVEEVIIVVSTKGGVGKSTLTALLGLALAEKGVSTGLLDVDFASPTLHVILGVPARVELEEVMGVKPYKVIDNLYILSPVFFAGETSLPLRGEEDVDALLELFTIGNWEGVNTLVIDTPPGLGDTQLTLFKLLRSVAADKTRVIAVTTPSRLSIKSLERSLPLVEELLHKKPIIVVNMADSFSPRLRVKEYVVAGAIRLDDRLEEAVGSPDKLRMTEAYKDVAAIVDKISRP